MPNEYLGVEFGVNDSSLRNFRSRIGRFASPHDPLMLARAVTMVETVAVELERALKEEFDPHNKSGETVRTFHVEAHGLTATIVMAGAAIYIEYGWAPHWIEGNPTLHWTAESSTPYAEEGEDVYRSMVWNPGYLGDDFVGRAVHRLDLERELNRVAYGVIVDVMGYAESSTGIQYTAGQQLGE